MPQLSDTARTLLSRFASREAHPLVQFVKYGIAGAIATCVDVTAVYVLAWTFFPAIDERLGVATRGRNFVICSVLAFMLSNLTAYLLNIAWVFKPGRHKRWVEVSMFYLVSGTSVAIGTFVGERLILVWGMSTHLAVLAKLLAALVINFVLRKFVVFKG